jgi:hypothetical protein
MSKFGGQKNWKKSKNVEIWRSKKLKNVKKCRKNENLRSPEFRIFFEKVSLFVVQNKTMRTFSIFFQNSCYTSVYRNDRKNEKSRYLEVKKTEKCQKKSKSECQNVKKSRNLSVKMSKKVEIWVSKCQKKRKKN